MQSPLKGKFLIASPTLRDPNFAGSVVLIVTHDENGAMGVIVNRPLNMTVAEAWKQVSEIPYDNEEAMHQGGPCEGMLMVLHGHEEDGQIDVVPGVWLTTDADAVRRLVDADLRPMKFVVGYAGWTSGQLEMELEEGAWLVTSASAGDVMGAGPDLWERLVRAATRSAARPNVDPRRIPPDPSVN